MTLDADTGTYKCSYLANANMHSPLSAGSQPPFQIAPPAQHFGKGPDFFFEERKKVLTSCLLTVSHAGECNAIVVAGSDGFWDNFLGDKENSCVFEPEISNKLKFQLESSVNDFYTEMGAVNEDFIRSYGKFLKNTVVNQMASPGGKSDDMSIFVGKIETCLGDTVSSEILDTSFFDGQAHHADIQKGKIKTLCLSVGLFVGARKKKKNVVVEVPAVTDV